MKKRGSILIVFLKGKGQVYVFLYVINFLCMPYYCVLVTPVFATAYIATCSGRRVLPPSVINTNWCGLYEPMSLTGFYVTLVTSSEPKGDNDLLHSNKGNFELKRLFNVRRRYFSFSCTGLSI